MNSLILGDGQVGRALCEILRFCYPVEIRDREAEYMERIEVLHICFPYSKSFIEDVKDYIEIYRPRYTVIHSTVPVGTARACQAFHSPVTGVHPRLAKCLKIFPKYLAPKDLKLKRYFEKAGIRIRLVKKTEDTEALKLWETVQYGMFVALEKVIYAYCQENDLDFNLVYAEANRNYNLGYAKLDMEYVTRPVLKHIPGKIGGHCVVPNCNFLDSSITKFIKKLNKTF